MLSKYDTCELVKELSTREGVEKISIGPNGIYHVEVRDDDIRLDSDNSGEGPIVILKIID